MEHEAHQDVGNPEDILSGSIRAPTHLAFFAKHVGPERLRVPKYVQPI
jgi:hypothetical protein